MREIQFLYSLGISVALVSVVWMIYPLLGLTVVAAVVGVVLKGDK